MVKMSIKLYHYYINTDFTKRQGHKNYWQCHWSRNVCLVQTARWQYLVRSWRPTGCASSSPADWRHSGPHSCGCNCCSTTPWNMMGSLNNKFWGSILPHLTWACIHKTSYKKSNVYVTLNAIGSFQCNLCSHWLIQIFVT